MSVDYAREKFWQAVHTLATNDGSIQERLEGAATFLMRLGPADLPNEQLQEFQAVWHSLTKENAIGNEGTIRASTQRLTPEEGQKLAARILDIYTSLHGGI